MTKLNKTEKGFTLVELAIVLVIVGLLIAGILKGQELITNSQMTSTISQIEAIGGAVNTFKQNYGAYPGDMANASTRLQDCDGATSASCNNGNGNSVLNVGVGAAPAAAGTDEAAFFFNHLRAAEIITGFDGTVPATGPSFGTTFPNATIGGGYTVGDTRGGAASGFAATGAGAEMRQGPYLVLTGVVGAVNATAGVLTPSQGARIDRTLDDGATDSGIVIAQNTAATCRGAAAAYAEDQDQQSCAIAYRLPR